MLVRIIDNNGYFLRDDFTEEITPYTIETPCPQGFYLPKWDGEKWIEGKTASELAVIESARQVVVQQETNKRSMEYTLKLAIDKNKTYLAIVAPTNAQKEEQTRQLTKQMNKVLRLMLNQLDDIT